MRNIIKQIIAVVRSPNPETLQGLSLISRWIFQHHCLDSNVDYSLEYRRQLGSIARVVRVIEVSRQKPNDFHEEDPAFRINFDLACAEMEADMLEPALDAWLLDLLEQADPVGYGYMRLLVRRTYLRIRLRRIREDELSEAEAEAFLKDLTGQEEHLIIMDRILAGDKKVTVPVGRVLARRPTLQPNFTRFVERYSRERANTTPRA